MVLTINKLRFILGLLFTGGFLLMGNAQVGEGGIPHSFHDYSISDDIPFVKMPYVDNQLLATKEQTEKTEGFTFGQEFQVDYNLFNAGIWTQLANGDRMWRLGVSSQGAYSINLVFNRFYLPENSTMFIYTKDKRHVLGAFTAKNNTKDKVFPTTVLPGDEIVIEYYEPKEVKEQAEIHLSSVVHAYKDVFFTQGKYGRSGPCHTNINCDEGLSFQDVKRSVALILYINQAMCTGSLINNTANDETPYLLTAKHCLTNKNPSFFVFIFGYETLGCDNNTGSNGFSISGATLVADGSNSDFALLKLNTKPPFSYNPYYAGWNRSNIAVMPSFCIHHPSGDYKKISICTSILESSSYDEIIPNTHWEVTAWSKGATEAGSSGSALLNFNKQIIGQLEGGTSSCYNPTGYDLYGKLSYSWTNNDNSNPNKRLKDWLDPLNTEAYSLEAYDPCIPKYQYDASILEINYPTASICQYYVEPEITIENLGSDTLTQLNIAYKVESTTYNYLWEGSLAFKETESIVLPHVDIVSGDYTLTVWIVDSDENPNNDTLSTSFTFQKGISFVSNIKTDMYPEQTSWILKDTEGNIIARNPIGLMPQTVYNDTLCLDTGCYDFVIYDSNGLHGNNGSGAGYYYLYLNYEQIRSGVQFEGKDSIRFCIDKTSSIRENKLQHTDFKVIIYPNPAHTIATISINEYPFNEKIYATIYSLDGRKIHSTHMKNKHQQIDISNFQSGIYIVEIKGESHFSVQKLIIQK